MESLVNGLFDFFIAIFTIITTPLQNVINDNIPSLNDFASNIGSFFALINSDWIPWIKDLMFIPQWTFDLLIGFLLFKLISSLAVNVVKLVLKYWAVLVP